MKNKFSKFINLQGKYLTSLLFVLFFAVGQMWAADYSGLNYNEGTTLPNGYKYYGSSTDVENKSAFSITTCDGVNVFDVTAGGSGAYNKRAIEFTITEDCPVEVKLHTGNNGRVFRMYNGSSTVVKEVTLTSKGNEYTFTYDFTGATPSSPKTYSFSGSGSKTYISKITFTSSCSATAPGNISKGTLSAGILTLNAAGSPATNNVWYWQTSATGTDKTNSGTSFNVSAAGTYYVRSLYDNDCWSAAKSITVNATDLVANYTVTYKDGTTTLGSEVVAVGAVPAGITAPTKDCYTFAAWDPALSTVSGTKDQVIEVSATWTPRYASSFNFGAATDLTKNNIASKLDTKNIACSVGDKGSYDAGGTTGYLGYKFKNNGDYIAFLVQEGYEAIVTYGYTESGWTVNGADAGVATKTQAYVDKKYQAPTGGGAKLYKLVNQSADSKTSTLSNIVIQEIPAVDNDATLSDLKVGGVTVPGFSANTHTYYYEVPYGTALADFPQISATANSAKAKQVAIEQAVWTGEPYNCYRAQANVQAEDNSWGYYDVRFYFGPKFGVELIKVATTGGTNKTVIGLYAGDGDVNLSNSTKMDDGKYIGFTLDGTTLQAGDQINVHTTTAANSGGSHVIFYDNMTDKNELYETGEIGGKGNNMFTINAAMVDHATAYVYRSNADAAHKWNGYVDNIAVYRLMAPFIESFEIAGIGALTINGTNITAEVSQDFDVTALTPTIKYWGNGGGAIDKTGAQDFTNPVEYTVSSAYADDATGDYAPVTYTVTITKVVPSATPNITTQPQGANYYEGATIAALSVVATAEDGGNLTYQWYKGNDAIVGETEDTYTPDVTEIGSYSYKCEVTNKKGDKPAASVMSSVATIVIAEDPATIKLLNGSTVNTTDFITGVTATETVQFKGNTVNYVKFAGTCGSVTNVKDLTKVIAYNATTNKTRIQISAHNNSTSARSILVKGLVEGADAAVDLATIDLGNKEDKVSDWIEFNNAANRTIYIMVGSSAGDVYFTQVKVVESGETTLKRAGEAGYSLNFDKGRFFGIKNTTRAFEGMTVGIASSDCAPLSTSVVKLASTSISFDVAAPVTLTVTTNNNKTYYVGTSASATTNETAKTGASEFELTEGTWYITAGSSNVEITNIAFAAPKCAEPAFNALANSELCAGDAFVALDGTATVADAGEPTYQWYNAEGDVAIEGATEATYTPTADGSYYVIAVNHLADHSDNAKQSATVTVEHFAAAQITTAPENQRKEAGQNATLTVVAEGKAPLSYQWYTCDENGDNAVIIAGAEAASYEVEVTAGMSQYYKVVVGSGCGEASAVAKVEEWAPVAQANVTGSITWDWTNTAWPASGTASFKIVDGELDLLANQNSIVPNKDGENGFRSDMLLGSGQYVWRAGGADKKCFQGTTLKFHTEVAGKVTVYYRSTSNGKEVSVSIHGQAAGSNNTGNYVASKTIVVPANADVLIEKTGETYVRINKIVFVAEDDYHRTVNPSYLGTLCWTNNAVLFGATLYELAGKDESSKLVFDEVPGNRLVAGKPYIFMPENGNTEIKLYNTSDEALTEDQAPVNHMYGTIVGKELVPGQDDNMYYFSSNHIWAVKDFVVNINVPAYYCYIDYPAVLADEPAPAPAPGRRRVSMGVQGSQVATGFEAIEASEKPMKLMINGQIFILRGEKLFDATGRLVK